MGRQSLDLKINFPIDHVISEPNCNTEDFRAFCITFLSFHIRKSLRNASKNAFSLVKVSPTFGEWVGYEISAKLWNQIFIPVGFAHGFCTLEDNTEVMYKVTAPYSPENERGLAWNDDELAIDWPIDNNAPILSEKDTSYPELRNLPTFFKYEF